MQPTHLLRSFLQKKVPLRAGAQVGGAGGAGGDGGSGGGIGGGDGGGHCTVSAANSQTAGYFRLQSYAVQPYLASLPAVLYRLALLRSAVTKALPRK